MQARLQNLNPLPVRAWSALNINDVSIPSIPLIRPYSHTPAEFQDSAGISVQPIDQMPLHLADAAETGIAGGYDAFVQANQNAGHLITIAKDTNHTQPLLLDYLLDEENPTLVDDTVIIAESGSSATVLIRYSAVGGQPLFHCGRTRVILKPGAQLRLIKVQSMKDADVHLDAVAVYAQADARADILLCELGASHAVGNCLINLTGERADVQLDSIYLGTGERKLDLNYRINHHAPQNTSSLQARGALLDRCRKVFRGTLDFLRGAAGSNGEEAEHTVLLSPLVRNLSAPLLLCGEDNVIGQHAASTGKLDEAKLFYLMSRGLSELAAKKLIIEASFNPLLDKIPLEDLRAELTRTIHQRLNAL